MRVALDLRWLQQAYLNSPNGGLGGIAAFSRNLWTGLAASGAGDIELVALLNGTGVAPAFQRLIDLAPGRRVIRVGGFRGLRTDERATSRLLSRLIEAEVTGLSCLSRQGVDVLHVLDQTPPPRRAAFATVMTIYDLLGFAAAPPTATIKQRLLARYQQASAARFHRAAALAPISEATACEVRRQLPRLAARIDVIRPGISITGDKLETPATDRRSAPAVERYLLHVGLLTPRKNPVGLIAGFSAWASDHGRGCQLVCVGPYEANGAVRRTILELATSHGVADLVSVRDAVSESALQHLYRRAEALVFPSLAEGFGLPLAESLACGTPCVASDQPVAREAAGKLGIYVDPDSSADIGRGIAQAVEPGHQARVRREGPAWGARFSVTEMAARYVCLYRSAAGAGARDAPAGWSRQ